MAHPVAVFFALFGSLAAWAGLWLMYRAETPSPCRKCGRSGRPTCATHPGVCCACSDRE
jgi:hypothetical protein